MRFKNQGLDAIEVQDNGSGIAPSNYESVALKHYTSKLSNYADLDTLETFGFRGEALSSLCALSHFTIITCIASDVPRGTKLDFDSTGKLKGTSILAAREGTTVSVEEIFHNLPVRRRELQRNIKREWNKVLALLHQYACVQVGLKLTVSQQPTKGKRVVLFSTRGNLTTRENIINVFGAKTATALVALDLMLQLKPTTSSRLGPSISPCEIQVLGHVSKPVTGDGRQTPDRQMFFVNGRPCNLPQFAKVFNEVYKSYNPSQSPFIFADIRLDTRLYDVNVSPDKRTILLHEQTSMLENLRDSLVALFETQDYTVPVALALSSRDLLVKKLSNSSKGRTMSEDPINSGETEADTLGPAASDGNFSPASPLAASSPPASHSAAANARPTPDHIIVQPAVSESSIARAAPKHAAASDHQTTRHLSVLKGKRPPSIISEESDSDPSEASSSDIEDSVETGPRSTADATKTSGGSFDASAEDSILVASLPVDVVASDPNTGARSSLSSARDTAKPVAANEFGRDMRHAKNPTNPQTTSEVGRSPHRAKDSRSVLSARRLDAPPSVSLGGRLTQLFAANSTGSVTPAPPRTLASPARETDLSSESSLREVGASREQSEDPDVSPSPKMLSSHDSSSPSTWPKDRATTDQRWSKEDTLSADRINDEAASSTLGQSPLPAEDALVRMDRKRKESTLRFIQHLDLDGSSIGRLAASWAGGLTKNAENQTTPDFSTQDSEPEEGDAEERLSLTILKTDFDRMKIVGQFNKGFILAVRDDNKRLGTGGQDGDELFIVDQHAADEKYNFERLQATTSIDSQRLVRPKQLQLTAVEEEIVKDNLSALEMNGFKVEIDESGDFSVGSRCHLLALPLTKETTFGLADLEELISMLGEHRHSSPDAVPRPSKVRKMFAMRACRSSVMIGKDLTERQMVRVVRHMGELDKPWNCPHGRPTMRHMCHLGIWDRRGWDEGRRFHDETSDVDGLWKRYVSQPSR